ncbi:GNAT family N-acetyltransferase [Actinoplanes sichuanensis]|uniref:GNAT family N-acetyltransferase n=1 Tax=Actinoplanes sichuanensis TaxID=512349 RepID=A0ABW4AQ03_9ACTN|nr:GNAT family N-acetyltransferase [Actinoplanes sichuanensis]
MTKTHIYVAEPGLHLAEAAAIWARATAARDNDPEVAPLSLALPLIERVIESSPRARLLIAEADGRIVGFAAVEPMPADESTAHIRYLGVDPENWGSGVGRHLTTELPTLLTTIGYTHGELEVYLDNPRAVELYEALGWLPHGDAAPHPRSGRLEQRYRLTF